MTALSFLIKFLFIHRTENSNNLEKLIFQYNAFNVYCLELAPGTVSLTGYRAQGDESKHCAYYNRENIQNYLKKITTKTTTTDSVSSNSACNYNPFNSDRFFHTY